jgi:cytoskeleton protein RodZ
MNNELEQAPSDAADAAFPDRNIKPGTLLRQKRESLHLTQQQVAEKLRLRITLIQSLEENNFNLDKVKTFTRGYVRSYARVVGIEEKVILASYDAFCGVEPQELDMKSFSKRTKRDAHNSRINYITFGIILIVIGISSIWWYQNQSKDTLLVEGISSSFESEEGPQPVQTLAIVNELPNSAANVDTIEPSLIIEPTTVLETDERDLEGPMLINTISASSPVTDESVSAVSETNPVESSTPAEANAPTITMTFIDECWIQVKDATGKTLSIGLKKPGQVVSVDGQSPFNVILGAPESVSMTFASEPVDLSRYTSGKVARFTLPR